MFLHIFQEFCFSPALPQRILLKMYFIVFNFSGKGVKFFIKFLFILVKKAHFSLVYESWSKIQLLEPP